MTNYLRQIRNQVRAISREKERVMREIEEQIASTFNDERETADFRFDAFSIWGGQPGDQTKEVLQYLRKNNLYTDDWFRGVFSLNKEQALTLGRLVAKWNQDWVYAITHDMADYNAFTISFEPATGSEQEIHTTSPNGHPNISCQWN